MDTEKQLPPDENGNFRISLQRTLDDFDRRMCGESVGDKPKLQRFYGECLHNTGTLEIDESLRTIKCTACGNLIDSFQAVLVLHRNRSDIESKIRVLEILEKRHQECKTIKKKQCKHKHACIMSDGSKYCPSCELLIKNYIKLNKGE